MNAAALLLLALQRLIDYC